MTNLATTDQGLDQLEQYRVELRGYCYRMLGSIHDADDAVQESFVKAWQGFDGFQGRSSMRSWPYRIATNTCLDLLRAKQRRALPVDLSDPIPAPAQAPAPGDEATWVQPVADSDVLPAEADPAQRAVLQDSIRLAFVAALQHLPPRQRAVLILREVLCWRADEVAELLDTSVASVNSGLQRARATLAERKPADTDGPAPVDKVDPELLKRYVAAFEAYDIEALVQLLHSDGSISMPPWEMWMRGREDLMRWYVGGGAPCRGSRMQPLVANGQPAFAHWKPKADGTGLEKWSIQVLDVVDGQIQHIHHFVDLDGSLFRRFGLPVELPA